jgi:hypothetical protein
VGGKEFAWPHLDGLPLEMSRMESGATVSKPRGDQDMMRSPDVPLC